MRLRPEQLRFVQVPHHGSRRNVEPSVLDRLLGPRRPTDHTTRSGIRVGHHEGTAETPGQEGYKCLPMTREGVSCDASAAEMSPGRCAIKRLVRFSAFAALRNGRRIGCSEGSPQRLRSCHCVQGYMHTLRVKGPDVVAPVPVPYPVFLREEVDRVGRTRHEDVRFPPQAFEHDVPG